MADMNIAQKIDHFEVESLMEESCPHHGITGFDTTEKNLPPGYFRSSFFVGTMSVLESRSSCDVWLILW